MKMTDNYAFSMAEPEVITKPNRYLLIATSGGLNQQRTGVLFWTIVIIINSNTVMVAHGFHAYGFIFFFKVWL
jgi:hypothetical protein